MATRIQVRRDLAANWTSNNPTLASGEIGLETDTRKWKIGNGSSNWTSLEYQLPSMTGSWASTPDENVLRIDRSTKRVGINTASLLHDLDVGGTFRATGNSTIGGTLGVTGNTTLTGDLAVNGGDVTTTATGTATVFNTNATTLNIGGAATTIGIGAATGTATINNATTAIAGAATVGGTLAVTGNTTLTGDLAVNGADITTTATGTATVFNTNATTLNVGQAATTVSIGATTGTATIRNATTAITGSATIGGNATISGSLSVTGATTFDPSTGAPSYAADPSNNNVLTRKSYVDTAVSTIPSYELTEEYTGPNTTNITRSLNASTMVLNRTYYYKLRFYYPSQGSPPTRYIGFNITTSSTQVVEVVYAPGNGTTGAFLTQFTDPTRVLLVNQNTTTLVYVSGPGVGSNGWFITQVWIKRIA